MRKVVSVLSTCLGLVVLSFMGVASSSATQLQCLGTEPFWGLDVEDGVIKYSDIDDNITMFELKEKLASINHTNRWIIQGADSKEGKITISLNKTEQCSDDMSDFAYEYDVTFVMGEKAFSGCCNRMK
ncbi:hypothetical protein [Agarivorans aestuarii]|uniref:hypothetical protein n=1 Tax=Agarivorans aestuarii TaxID=1563703 RepID=UPI001C8037AF|nr:hypothetical protein [Agarivorans aestuarii]